MINDIVKGGVLLRIILAVMLGSVGVSVYIAYQTLAPGIPVVINKVGIVTPVVSDHGVLMYRFDYCKNVETLPIVYRQLIPATGEDAVPFPSVLGITKKGCHVTNIPLQMIPGTKPGKYRLRGHLVYQVNSFRSVSVDYLSDEFEVTK